MTYDGTTLKVTITDTVTQATASQSYAVNIPSLVGGNTAYVGFTGGTGGLTAVQKILNWTYTPGSTPVAQTGLTATAGNGQVALTWSAAHGRHQLQHLSFDQQRRGGDHALCDRPDIAVIHRYRGRQRHDLLLPGHGGQRAGPEHKSNEASAMPTAPGGLNFSGGFASAGSTLTLNGSAKLNGSALQLTDGGTAEAASTFSTSAVNISSFSTQFSFQIKDTTNPGADGFTFCIQGVGPTALGLSGGAGLRHRCTWRRRRHCQQRRRQVQAL